MLEHRLENQLGIDLGYKTVEILHVKQAIVFGVLVCTISGNALSKVDLTLLLTVSTFVSDIRPLLIRLLVTRSY